MMLRHLISNEKNLIERLRNPGKQFHISHAHSTMSPSSITLRRASNDSKGFDPVRNANSKRLSKDNWPILSQACQYTDDTREDRLNQQTSAEVVCSPSSFSFVALGCSVIPSYLDVFLPIVVVVDRKKRMTFEFYPAMVSRLWVIPCADYQARKTRAR